MPVLYVTHSKDMLEKFLKNIFKTTISFPSPITDVESAIGSCMEFRVLHHFNKLIDLQKVSPENAATYPDLRTICLNSFESRFGSLPNELEPDFLYLSHSTHAIDYMAMLKLEIRNWRMSCCLYKLLYKKTVTEAKSRCQSLI